MQLWLSGGSGYLTWVGRVAGVDREGAVEHGAVDGVFFCSVIVFVQVVCV